MDFIKIGAEDFEGLMVLQTAYKAEMLRLPARSLRA